MNFDIPEELKQVQLLARRFVEKELMPFEQEIETKGELPDDLRLKLQGKARSLGLWALDIPEELGGAGLGTLGTVLVHEELGKTIFPLANTVAGPQYILLKCNPVQKQRFLFPCIRGEKIACFALSEPAAGSDAARIETHAERVGNKWLVNGVKHFISNAKISNFAIVFAVTDRKKRTGGGITCFLIEKNIPGFSLGRHQEMMGQRGYQQHELIFENCEVSDENILGNLGNGFSIAMEGVGRARLYLNGARVIGLAERAFKLCREYAKQRVTFGLPLSERQGVRWMLADVAMGIHIARLLVYSAASEIERGVPPKEHAPRMSMMKLYATEMVNKAADTAVQIFGGMGYCKEMPLERIYRDVRVLRIWDGPSEIHRDIIARSFLNK